MKYIAVPLLGFSNGIIVGSGAVALLTLLDIVPRLAQVTDTYDRIKTYENVIIIGAVLAAVTTLAGISINLGKFAVVIVGSFIGVFVGLLASALAEVLNVIPIVIRRFGLEGYAGYIVYSLVAGKVLGALLNWFLY